MHRERNRIVHNDYLTDFVAELVMAAKTTNNCDLASLASNIRWSYKMATNTKRDGCTLIGSPKMDMLSSGTIPVLHD